MIRSVLMTGAAVAAMGGIAQADELPLAPRAPVSVASVQVTPLTTAQPLFVRTLRPGQEGIAQTSIAFNGRKATTTEAGFMCGLMPHPDTSGAAAAFGHDPHGRFVGAKLKVAF